MMMQLKSFGIQSRTVAALLALASIMAGGCSSSPRSNVRVTSLASRQHYTQEFQNAYARHNAAGDVDVVITKDSQTAMTLGGERTTGSAGAESQRVHQVMHVRVLWQPMKGTKTDSPTATNATLSWFVFGDDGRATRMIEYGGAAFVDVTRKGGQTILAIRNATLKPTGHIGDLNDPIGAARLQGTIVARNASRQVGEVLSDTKMSIGAAQASARIEAPKGASSQLPAD
jgi:hypothetical protein